MDSACTKCGSGTYNANTASTTSAACVDCPAGRYAPTTGTQINTGEWSLVNGAVVFVPTPGFTESVSCRPCLRGKYCTTPGLSLPTDGTDCASGKYSTEFGQISSNTCVKCPEGTVGVKGETGSKSPEDCKSCRPGKFIGLRESDGVTCANCPHGRFQDERGEID